MFHRAAAALLLGLALAATLPAAALPATAPATMRASTDESRLTRIIASLTSDDFTTRQSAQIQLDQLPPTCLQGLERLAQDAADPQVQASLRASVAAHRARLAVHPLPISIDLTNATAAQCEKALAAQLETKVRLSASPRNINLHLQNASFVDLMRTLDDLAPGDLYFGRDQLTFMGSSRRHTRTCTDASVAWVTNCFQFQANQQYVCFSLMVDPRVRIADIEILDAQATDDEGRLCSVSFPDSRWGMNPSPVTTGYFFYDAGPKGKRTLSKVTGLARLAVIVDVQTLDVPDPAKILNQPVSLGGAGALTLTTFTATPNKIEYGSRLSHQRAEAEALIASGKASDLAEFMISGEILDARNQTVLTLNGNGGGSMSSSGGLGHALPYHIRFTRPTRLASLTVPFELRDIRPDR